MRKLIETWDLSQMLSPSQDPSRARTEAVAWGANLTVRYGQAIGRKTSDNKCYPFVAPGASGATNEVQTVVLSGTLSAGAYILRFQKADGSIAETPAIAYNASTATMQGNVDTALGGANLAVVGGTNAANFTLTFSGAGYAGIAQPPVVVDINTAITGLTSMSVTRTTPGGVVDGTGQIVGFAKYSFKTDASGLVYIGSSDIAASPDYRSGPYMSSPIYRSGTFDPNDLVTGTLVAQVTTITPGGTIEVGDLFTLTLTKPNLTTKAVTVAATATTAANVAALMIAAWNADPELAQIATASGTNTIVLTAVNSGISFTVAATTTESDGTGADSQTFTAAATTAAAGISTAAILAALPGSRILANGHLLVP